MIFGPSFDFGAKARGGGGNYADGRSTSVEKDIQLAEILVPF